MKKFWFVLLLALPVTLLFHACNNSTETSNTAAGKVTDIPASTKSKEALAAFKDGLLAYDLNETKKANTAFSKAIELDPGFGLAYLFKANTSTTTKEYTDNINAGKAKMDSASEWEKLFADYLSAGLNGDRNNQLETLKKIAAAYPDAARAQVDLGAGYAGNNQIDKARECFQKAIQLNPGWVGGYSSLGFSYIFSDPKDLKKAEENMLKLVELSPTSAGSQIALGDCYRAQNDFQKAKEAYAKAAKLDPVSPDAYYKEGHANTYLGNMEEARKNYVEAGNHDVSKAQAVLSGAYTYLYGGDDYKKAITYIMDAAAKPDTSAAAQVRLADEKNGYYNNCAAIAIHFGDAGRLKQLVPLLLPLSAQLNNQLGTAEGKLFIKADSLYWDAMVAITEGKPDIAKAKAEAMKIVLDPIKDDRKLENYYYVLGMADMKQKNYAEAITHFEKTDPNNIYNKYCQAMAQEAAGNKDKATTLYKEIAAYNFNNVGNALIRAEVKKKLAAAPQG